MTLLLIWMGEQIGHYLRLAEEVSTGRYLRGSWLLSTCAFLPFDAFLRRFLVLGSASVHSTPKFSSRRVFVISLLRDVRVYWIAW